MSGIEEWKPVAVVIIDAEPYEFYVGGDGLYSEILMDDE